ncbi:transcriptional regulator [Campylobacterota bacterium]|nr:transcriptional regulator [Campylobacterota bacterium]
MSVYESIVQGLNEAIAYEKGELEARTMVVERKPTVSQAEVKRIRKEIGLTQAKFALSLGVSHKTVEAWERGQNKPSGASLRLLEIVRENPQVIAKYV